MLDLDLFLQCNACDGGLGIFDRQPGISYCCNCTLQTISGAESKLGKKVEYLHSPKIDAQPNYCVNIFDQVKPHSKFGLINQRSFAVFLETELQIPAGKIKNLSRCCSARAHTDILKQNRSQYTLCDASSTNLKALDDAKIPKGNRLVSVHGSLHELTKQLLNEKGSGYLLDSVSGDKVKLF